MILLIMHKKEMENYIFRKKIKKQKKKIKMKIKKSI
jgi:hypothetical protein